MFNYLLPPGFKDEIYKKTSLEHDYTYRIINLFQKNGYELVKPPLVEYARENNLKNAFVFKEDKETRNYIIRNDITLQVARLASARLKNKIRPLKLCYYGEVIRKKGSILRPERQFLQVGAECIGENTYFADVEMIDLAYKALTLVGIKNISIELSSSAFLNFLFQKIKNKKYWNKVYLFIKRKDLTNACKYIDKSFHKYINQILSCTGKFDEKKKALEKLTFNKNTVNTIKHLLNIHNKLKSKYPNINYLLDLSESDYLDYHTGVRFTLYAKNVRGEIARGGRYISEDKSLNESSTGFTCYMDTIIRASTFTEKVNKILVPFDTSENEKTDLINKGYVVETFFGNKKDIKKFSLLKKIGSCLINHKIKTIK